VAGLTARVKAVSLTLQPEGAAPSLRKSAGEFQNYVLLVTSYILIDQTMDSLR